MKVSSKSKGNYNYRKANIIIVVAFNLQIKSFSPNFKANEPKNRKFVNMINTISASSSNQTNKKFYLISIHNINYLIS